MNMSDLISITTAADEIECSPQRIGDVISKRWVDSSKCPMIGGRHLIARDNMPKLRKVIHTRRIRKREKASAS